MHDHVDAGEPPGQRRIADVDDPPDHAGQVAAVLVDRDDPAEPVRLRQPGGQREPEIVRRAGHRHDGQVIARGGGMALCGLAQLVSAPVSDGLAPVDVAPPLANLGNSVAHREALLG